MQNMAPFMILLVEDDIADQKLVKASLNAQKVSNSLRIASSGEEALDLLHQGTGQPEKPGRPDLILLDLNMPGMGGKEFLKQLKNEDGLKQIPVVILSSSKSETDVSDGYRLHAAGYVQKPGSLDELKQVMGEIEGYWFKLCELPHKEL